MPLALIIMVAAASPAASSKPVAPIRVVVGVTNSGSASDTWCKAISERDETSRALCGEKQPLSSGEREWLDVIELERAPWDRSRPDLDAAFGLTIDAPTIIVGNRGGPDAFTVGDDVIALNLAEWARIYGSAKTPENKERLRRILSHEYTHLLTKAWRKGRDVPLDTALDRALWECFYEGLGNLRSLSPLWLGPAGLSALARNVLHRLSPVLVERLRALAEVPDAAREAMLRRGLSEGRFEDKWGALPVALWLAAETHGRAADLRKLIERGPSVVLELAKRHLPERLRDQLPVLPRK